MRILITGAAGFIGFHLSKRILEKGHTVIGFDNLNNYYEPTLKKARLEQLEIYSKQNQSDFIFIKGNLQDKLDIENIFKTQKPERVVNLAAQAGVRYSIDNPFTYIESNLVGFANILESCRHGDIEHLVYASVAQYMEEILICLLKRLKV